VIGGISGMLMARGELPNVWLVFATLPVIAAVDGALWARSRTTNRDFASGIIAGGAIAILCVGLCDASVFL
jgi:hypothetical protein